MALIRCLECEKEVSDRAPACIHCGCPMEVNAEHDVKNKPDTTKLDGLADDEPTGTPKSSDNEALRVQLDAKTCPMCGKKVGFFSSVDLKDCKVCMACMQKHGCETGMSNLLRIGQMTFAEFYAEINTKPSSEGRGIDYQKYFDRFGGDALAALKSIENTYGGDRSAHVAELNRLISATPVDDDEVRCPKCGSTSLSANKKGFGVGKALVGAALTGGVGLLAGGIGMNKIEVTCLKCGKRFKAGKGA